MTANAWSVRGDSPVPRKGGPGGFGGGVRRPQASGAGVRGGAAWVCLGLAALIAGLGAVHLTQGTAPVGLADIVGWLLGGGSEGRVADVVLASRLPRLAAGVLVGLMLGTAGCAFQAIARNPLASPDTLAVNAGAHLAVTFIAAFGISLGALGGTGAAFLGGLAGAAAVLALTRGDTSPARLVLVGSVVALALAGLTSALMLVFGQETSGLFAWGAGSLSQAGLVAIGETIWVAAPALLVLAVLAGRLDLLQLGDDAARSLGVSIRGTRVGAVLAAVLLSSAAVSLVGPLGFVGLCAPAAVKLLVGRIPRLSRHRWLLPTSALTGAAIVVFADVALRALLGAQDAVEIPSGVVTTLLGAITLVALSSGLRTGRADASPALIGASRSPLRRRPSLAVVVGTVLLGVASLLALMAGDGFLPLGDVANWLQGVASGRITFILDARLPRVLAGVLAGACLALSGSLTQAAVRNPLADPGILGVSAGAGMGAMAAMLSAPGGGFLGMAMGALAGAGVAAATVFGLTARGGFEPTRVVLVGVGVSAAAAGLTTVLVIRTDPWNQSLAITWLGGSTYGAHLGELSWVVAALILGVVATVFVHRDLDVLQLDADTPVLLGVGLSRTRLLVLGIAVLLSAAATVGVGVIGFVGLVAPHTARLLVGARHRWLVPSACLVGALLVLLADTLGRSVIAPAQLPVGLVCALVGAPYFLWLMARMRA